MWAIPDGGLGDSLGVNLPAVAIVATSGVGAMMFMFHSIVKFQRELTNVYIDENKKLRLRVDTLAAEVAELKRAAATAERALMRYEADCERRIYDLEQLVKRAQTTADRNTDRKLDTLLDHDDERDKPGLRYDNAPEGGTP